MGKELYDTNILIKFWREKKRDIIGYTTILNIIEFPKALLMKWLTILYPTIEDLNEAVNISKELMKIGKPIGAIDIVMACVAIRNDLTLVTMDTDLENVKIIKPHLKIKLIKKSEHPS